MRPDGTSYPRRYTELEIDRVDIVAEGANQDVEGSTGEGSRIVLWKSKRADAGVPPADADMLTRDSAGQAPPTANGRPSVAGTAAAKHDPTDAADEAGEAVTQPDPEPEAGEPAVKAKGRQAPTVDIDAAVEAAVTKARKAADAEIAKLRADADQLAKALAQIHEAEADRVFAAKADALGALVEAEDRDTLRDTLKALAATGGDLYQRAEQMLQKVAARVSGDVLGEIGSTAAAKVVGDAEQTLMAVARDIATAKGISVDAAMPLALEQRPDLYRAYKNRTGA